MDIIDTALEFTTYALFVLVALGMIRVLIGPRVEDRMIGLNLVSGFILAILVVTALRIKKAIFLDVALVYAILGYIGTLVLAQRWEKDPK